MKHRIKRIIVTGDTFRTTKDSKWFGGQNKNIDWLYQLIRPSIEEFWGGALETHFYSGNADCLASRICKAKGVELDFDLWTGLYNKMPNNRELSIIEDHFHESFIVGFELSNYMCHGLKYLGIPYVDFALHPVRFMDDIFFGIRSNVPLLSEALGGMIVEERTIKLHAGMSLASLSQLSPLKAYENLEDVGLFCCQTSDDKVLIKNGRLIMPFDYMDKFSEMSKRHERILIKPHPLDPDNEILMSLTRLFNNTEITTENIYHLISQKPVKNIYSITSSTSIEAAYLGKNGVHLEKYPYLFSEESMSYLEYLSIDSNIYSSEMWLPLLETLGIEVISDSIKVTPKTRNQIRRSLRAFWGANIFELN